MIRAAIFFLCLVPLMVLSWRWVQDDLGFNRVEAVSRFTGDWAFRFLLITLAISPIRRLPKLNSLIRYRRMAGLFAFFYASLHFWHYLAIDMQFMWDEILGDLQFRRFFIAGFIAWLLMLPLAVTSTAAAIRKLGGRRWQLLHRLIYASAIAATIHYLWQGKSLNLEPLIYAAIVVVLLGYRAGYALYRRRTRPSRVWPSEVR